MAGVILGHTINLLFFKFTPQHCLSKETITYMVLEILPNNYRPKSNDNTLP